MKNCTNLTYTVRSPHESEKLTLYVDGPCKDAELSWLTVALTFSPCNCPIGFERSPESGEISCNCTCNSLISEYIDDCNVTTASFVRKKNSWISHTVQNNVSVYIFSQPCPFGFCRSQSATTRISFNMADEANAQCSEGRTGTLCGACAENYSISLGSKRCISCPNEWPVLFVAIVFGSIFAGLGLTILIMITEFTVSVGTINGFIFYANIVDVYDGVFLPFEQMTFPTFLIESLNLNPGFDVCSFDGMNMYGRTWTRFLFPAYLISIVLVIIIVSGCSPKFSRLVGKRNPVATLTTLLLLSYTSLVQNALIAMTPETLKHITTNVTYYSVVWQPDGNVVFFEPKHAFLFLLALVVVVMTIAYKVLIFSWQWIVRLPRIWILKWTRNQKLNLFIRVHQAPYNDRHRYWTGLLLLTRALLILILTFTESIDPKISILTLVTTLGTLFLLKMTHAKKIYRKWPVDLLETVLLFNLFVYACITWYAIDDASMRRSTAYVSVIFMFVLLLSAIAYHVYAYILTGIWPSLKIGRSAVKFYPAKRVTEDPNKPSNFYNQDQFREMLGSIDIQETVVEPDTQSNILLKSVTQKPRMSKFKPSISVVEFPDSDKEQSDQTTATEEDHSDAPYVMMDINFHKVQCDKNKHSKIRV